MKKNKLFSMLIFMGISLQAQIGVNTPDPKSTFEIVGKISAASPDGILIPRYTAAELGNKDNAYGADQNGTLVFVTGGVGISPKTINIKTVGFYFYDAPNSTWQPIKGDSNSGPITPGESISYTETFNINGTSNINLSSQPSVKPLPVIDGIMIDVNSYTGVYGYHPRFYNTTASPIKIAYTLGYNISGYSHSMLTINPFDQWFPFGDSNQYAGSTGNIPYWGGSYATNAMVTVMIKDKVYRIEWFCYSDNPANSNQCKVNIFITRLG